MLPLFPGESIVTQSDSGKVTLTTHRICYHQKEFGRNNDQDIMLEDITVCEVYATSSVICLIVGTVALALALIARIKYGSSFGFTFLLGIVFSALYFFSRKKRVIIASSSTTMYINVSGMNAGSIAGFVYKIRQTQNNRVAKLNKRA